MQLSPDFDKKLAELYSETVTVRPENTKKILPADFWKTMEVIAVNRKAMINFKIKNN